MKTKYYTIAASTLLILGACNKVEQEPIGSLPAPEQSIRVSITGTFEQPEWVHIDNDNAMRNFVLRPNEAGYPKIVLTSLENQESGFEPYPSIVHLYNSLGRTTNYRLEVEDDLDATKGESPKVTGTNKVSGASNAQKGTSRIIKKDGKYHVLVGFETSGKNGFSAGSDKTSPSVVYPSPYTDMNGYYVFVALNPKYRYDYDSQHRIYYPTKHRTTSNGPAAPPAPDLKHTVGDYEVARPTNVGTERSNGFEIPVFSDYNRKYQRTAPNILQIETEFHMGGVLVALKLDNRTGRNILVKRLRTRSNDLAYSGYFELWDYDWCNPKAAEAKKRHYPTSGPVFVRYDSSNWDSGRNRIHTYNIKDDTGANDYALRANASSDGRFYLWGAFDESHPKGAKFTGPWQTLVEIEYAYEDQPATIIKSATVDITPVHTAARRFEYGKAYLVTLPIKQKGA